MRRRNPPPWSFRPPKGAGPLARAALLLDQATGVLGVEFWLAPDGESLFASIPASVEPEAKAALIAAIGVDPTAVAHVLALAGRNDGLAGDNDRREVLQ
jgi:hypothetical protein